MDDQLSLPVIRLTSSMFNNSSNHLPSSKLVQKSGLMVAPCLSSNRSSISSTSSSSSSASNTGSSGSNYYTPQNISRISCDSGFSSVASSPQPQTPPMRCQPQSPQTTPTIVRSSTRIDTKLASSSDAKPDFIGLKGIVENQSSDSSPVAESSTAGEMHLPKITSTQPTSPLKKEPPPPPPRTFYRQATLPLQDKKLENFKKTSSVEKTVDDESLHKAPLDHNFKKSELPLGNDPSGSSKREHSQSNGRMQTPYMDVRGKLVSPSKTSKPLQPATPPVTERPSSLSQSRSTPIIRQIIYKQIPSPSANSQYNTSSASTPASQVSYSSLSSEVSTPSPTSSSTDQSTSDRLKRTISSSSTPSEETVADKECNNFDSQKCSRSPIKATTSPLAFRRQIGNFQHKPRSMPPAIPPRQHLKLQAVNIRNQPDSCEPMNNPRQFSITSDSAHLLNSSFYYENKKYNPTVDKLDNLPQRRVSSSEYPAPSPSPPPLPATSPPPLTPKEARSFYFLSAEESSLTYRRSSFPSTSAGHRGEIEDTTATSGNKNPSIPTASTTATNCQHINPKSVSDHSAGSQTKSMANSPKIGTSNSGSTPALYTSPQAIKAQKELQKAIESLKHLTTHELITAQDLIYI